MMKRHYGWMLLVAANALVLCVLSFFQRGDAAPPTGNAPFANSIEQRLEIVAQLKDVNAELKELNSFLRSGNLKVTIMLPDKTDKTEEK